MNSFDKLMKTETGKKLSDNREKIVKLAEKSDGQKVIGMLKGNNVDAAIKAGDTESLKAAIERAMKTEEGARLFSELSKLIES